MTILTRRWRGGRLPWERWLRRWGMGRWLLRVLAFAGVVAIAWYGVIVPVSLAFPVFGIRQVSIAQPWVALTYDDGPDPVYTEQIAALFDQAQAKTTFFSIGRWLDRYPEIARQMLARGHELANHSYSHRGLVLKLPSEVWQEVAQTDQRLRGLGLTGVIPMRPPMGKRFLILPTVLAWRGQPMVLWDIDSGDWQAETKREAIVERVLAQVHPGSIVLMHDGGGNRQETVAATAQLIPALQARGYRLVTVQQLLAARFAADSDRTPQG